MNEANRIESLPALVQPNTQILILGTIPGIESLRQKRYYGHPQNLFWPLLMEAFGQTPCREYHTQVDFLVRNRLGLWDVLASCQREGSLDAQIRGAQANRLDLLLEDHPQIATIALNGKTAAKFYKRFWADLGIDIIELPSSSPANASISREIKQKAWQKLNTFK